MAETGDLGLSVATAGIAYGNLDRLEAQLRGAEDQVEVSEWIEIAEVAATSLEPPVVGPAQRLGPAAFGCC